MAQGDLTVTFRDTAREETGGFVYGEGGDTDQQLTLTDAEVSGSRDNTVRYGLTGGEPTEVLEGNESYTASYEGDVSENMGDALQKLYDGQIVAGEFTSEQELVISFGEMVWNSFGISKSEDDDVATVSFEADLASVNVSQGSN
jgi:hypothetical protein